MLKRPLAVFLLAIAIGSGTTPVQAAPLAPALVIVETKFYSDATYTVQVGYKLLDPCSGDVEFWGTSTAYKIQKRTYCAPH